MISVTELRTGVTFEDQGQIYEVLAYEHIKLGRGSANIKVKIRNLRSGSTTEKSFISGAKVEDITPEKRKAQYLYQDDEGYHFMDSASFEQFPLSQQKIGDGAKFLKEGMEVIILTYEGEPLSLDLPLKMDFKIIETGPDVRGDSVSNIYKEAILENGLKIKVPLFVKIGEVIRVSTRTAQYLERAKV